MSSINGSSQTICKFGIKCINKRTTCKFVHIKLCKWYLGGHCSKGDECDFIHPVINGNSIVVDDATYYLATDCFLDYIGHAKKSKPLNPHAKPFVPSHPN